MIKLTSLALPFGLAFANFAFAVGQRTPTPVFLNVQKNDGPVIEQLIYELKEGLRNSSRFEVVSNEPDAVIELHIGLLDVRGDGTELAISVTWTARPIGSPAHIYLMSNAGYIRYSQAKSSALGLVARTDRALDEWNQKRRAIAVELYDAGCKGSVSKSQADQCGEWLTLIDELK